VNWRLIALNVADLPLAFLVGYWTGRRRLRRRP